MKLALADPTSGMYENKTIAYVEFGATGHRPIWVRSVIEAFEKLDLKWRLDVWVSKEFVEFHKEWCIPYLGVAEQSAPGVHFRFHEEIFSQAQEGETRNISKFEIILRCVEADNADVCFVANNLDACLKEIAFARPGVIKTKIVGVMDQPFLHYGRFSSLRTRKWLSPRRYLSMYMRNYLACHRPTLGEVLMLDHLAPDYYNTVLKTSKYRYLPEFVNRVDLLPDPRQHFGLPENRIILLLPGAISRRKGALEFLDGLQTAFRYPENISEQIAVVFAGPIDEGINDLLYERVSMLRSRYPNVPVLIFNRFLTDDEFVNLIAVSDVVCMPYVNFIGTSGILMHAAAYGRLVLASEFGVIGELVRRYDLGEVCNEEDPEDVAMALLRCVEKAGRMSNGKRQRIKSFADSYSISLEQFGEQVCVALNRIVLQ